MATVEMHPTSGDASAAPFCLRHRRSAAEQTASPAPPAGEAPLVRDLVEAVASLERVIDALRRDIESGERTIHLLTEACEASAGSPSTGGPLLNAG